MLMDCDRIVSINKRPPSRAFWYDGNYERLRLSLSANLDNPLMEKDGVDTDKDAKVWWCYTRGVMGSTGYMLSLGVSEENWLS